MNFTSKSIGAFMIYVFKTTVNTRKAVKALKPKLDKLLPNSKWNFDLEDCDNILRIDSGEIAVKQVIEFLKSQQFDCDELE